MALCNDCHSTYQSSAVDAPATAVDYAFKWLADALPDGGYWYLLGMRLGLPESELKGIRSSTAVEDQCKSEMLRILRSYGHLQPTMHTLLKALHSIGLNDLAQQLSYSHEKGLQTSQMSHNPEMHEYRPQQLPFRQPVWLSNRQPTPYDDIERDSKHPANYGHDSCSYVPRSPFIDTEKDMKKTPTPTHASPLPGQPGSPIAKAPPIANESGYVSRGPHHTYSSGPSSNSSASSAASLGAKRSNTAGLKRSHEIQHAPGGVTSGTAAVSSGTRYRYGMGSTLAPGPGVSGHGLGMEPVATYKTTSNYSISTDVSSSTYSGIGYTHYSGAPPYQPLSSQNGGSFREPDVHQYPSFSSDTTSMSSLSQCTESTTELLRSSCTSPPSSDSTAPSSQQLDILAHETHANLNLEPQEHPIQITCEPEDCEVLPNTKVEFVCEAHIVGSDEEPSFQWYKENDPLVGEINNQYVIERATQQDVGFYCCVVTDSTQKYSRRSQNAKLLLCEVDEPASSPQESTSKQPPVIVKQPNSYVETPAEEKLCLVIEVKGEPPLQYTWYKNTKLLPYAKSNVLEIPNASHLDSGQYCCSIANDCGSILSSVYAVKVIRKPVARGARRFQKNPGSAVAQYVQQPRPTSYHKWDEHISKPRISVQPYSSTVVYGQPLRLFVDVENPDSSTKFQWYRSNELINGRESRELLIHSVIDSDGGDYYCRVTNCAGSTDSQVARVSISNGQGPLVRAPDRWGQYGRMGYRGRGEPEDEDEPCGQPVPSSAPPTSANASTTHASSSSPVVTDKPVISVHPQPQEIELGDPLTLSCVATGSGELSYLWYFNGLSLNKEVQSTYTIHCFTDEDEGLYTCKVSNDGGSTMSQMAHVVMKLD